MDKTILLKQFLLSTPLYIGLVISIILVFVNYKKSYRSSKWALTGLSMITFQNMFYLSIFLFFDWAVLNFNEIIWGVLEFCWNFLTGVAFILLTLAIYNGRSEFHPEQEKDGFY